MATPHLYYTFENCVKENAGLEIFTNFKVRNVKDEIYYLKQGVK